MFTTKFRPHTFFSIFLTLSILLFSGNIFAKSCKEMSKSTCTTASSCTWVKGYTTKKGNKVSAYCRNKASKKAVSKKMDKKTNKAKTKISDTKKKIKDKKSAKKGKVESKASKMKKKIKDKKSAKKGKAESKVSKMKKKITKDKK